jgi:hypothetical protein
MNMYEDNILQFLYYLPKQLNWTVQDVLNMDYYWCEKVYNKLAKDLEEEHKRQEEERRQQEAEQQAREQEMRQQYASMQNNYNYSNNNY